MPNPCSPVPPLRHQKFSVGRAVLIAAAVFLHLHLAGCGGGQSDAAVATAPDSLKSAGQVAPLSAAPKVSFYAASRFAEQATFGATPALVAELQAKGFEKWIDEQLALPLVALDPSVAEEAHALSNLQMIPPRIWFDLDTQFMRAALSAPDQLRWRMMWSLNNFIVVARSKGDTPPGNLHWVNLLYRQAFGGYGDLLNQVTRNPFMTHFLDNEQNRPKSAECPQCAPNENYARELLQLFSIGVVKLGADGTPQRDSRGRFIESYTQADVEELARALTGWNYDPVPSGRAQRNWGNWAKPVVQSTWPPHRDAGRKVVLGRVLPAGQSAQSDLNDVVAMLQTHANMAPFISLRLIQHLVASDPSPAYVGRIAAVFRNNGSGVVGDMKAVVKAILLDVEARRGDNPGTASNKDGKFKEPMLHRTGSFRGLGCPGFSLDASGEVYGLWNQRLLLAESVFGFYAPTDRAAGSNLLAPEQRLVNASELTTRLSELNGLRWNRTTAQNSMLAFTQAGCKADEFVQAYATSPKVFIDLVAARFFRGAMPPTVRTTVEQLIAAGRWSDASEGAMRMLAFALAMPAYGVIK